MSKRYGRGQKQRHLELLAEQATLLQNEREYTAYWSRRCHTLENQHHNAEQEAFNRFLKQQDLFKYHLANIVEHLKEALPARLLPALQELARHTSRDNQPFPPLEFLISNEPLTNAKAYRLQGHIKQIYYNVIVSEGRIL